MIGLVDGDLFAYKASSAVQKDIDWGDGLWTCHAFLDDAITQFLDDLEDVENALKNNHGITIDKMIFAFSDPKENFRKAILPEYKANRVEKRKPTCYKGLVDWIEDEYACQQYSKLEADDVLGILSYITEDSIIISADKDFKTIPGKFYRITEDKVYNISEDEAEYWHMYQTLTGDTADNYKGCPGIGPKKAIEILDKNKGNLWKAVVDAYKKKGLTEEDALVQARVSYILRKRSEYDEPTATVYPYNPPKETT